MTSIRRYLFRTLAVTLAIITVLAVTAAYLISRHELEEILDAQLSITGRGLMAMLPDAPTPADYRQLSIWLNQRKASSRLYPASHALDDPLADQPDAGPGQTYHHEERKMGVGIWNAEGERLLLGPGWHKGEAGMDAPSDTGFEWVAFDDNRWRVFSLHDAQRGLWLRLGIEQEFFTDIVERVALNHLWPMLLLLPIALWWMLRLIRRGLAPIGQLSRQVQDRSADDLSHIELEVPHELRGLRGALNDFIARLSETLEKERRFTADAAHEMRTPLAGVKIHLDNALAGETNALPKARQGIERLQRVVEQLLTLARVDRRQFAATEPVDLRPLVLDLAAELWPLANARGQTLKIHDTPPAVIAGNAIELGILIRNLLDNALRYTPDGGRVDVRLVHSGEGTSLTIQDTGPGIPEAQLKTVTERFRRASDQRTTGSGLGLSIAVALAERHDATLTLANATDGGLIARLCWALERR